METKDDLLSRILEGERQIYSLLKELLTSQQNQSKLGFTSDRTIYIGGDTGWYFYAGEQQPIQFPSLKFRLTKIFVKEKEFKGNTNYKLCLVCDCGENNYTIESGMETYFSKAITLSLLLAIRQHKITKKTVLKLRVQKGDENVVFPHLYIEGTPIKVESAKDSNTFDLLEHKEFAPFLGT
jgi:hypothetical protein